MPNHKIFLVEPKKNARHMILSALIEKGYQVFDIDHFENLSEFIRNFKPDMILLGTATFEGEAFSTLKKLKNDPILKSIPVFLVAGSAEDVDIVVGLELGADDVLVAPVNPRVLIARIKAVLRGRSAHNGNSVRASEQSISIDQLRIDPNRFLVEYKGRPLSLTPSEFSILYLLASDPGRPFSRREILGVVKGRNYSTSERAVDVQVAGLRRKLGRARDLIGSVRGIGYRLYTFRKVNPE